MSATTASAPQFDAGFQSGDNTSAMSSYTRIMREHTRRQMQLASATSSSSPNTRRSDGNSISLSTESSIESDGSVSSGSS